MLTLAQAAAILGRSPDTLRRQVHNGRLRATLIGKTWVVTEEELERYRAESLGHLGRPAGAKDSAPRKTPSGHSKWSEVKRARHERDAGPADRT